SLGTVTPALVIVGLPNFRAMTSFRHSGPSVTFTAWAMVLIPRKSAARASSLKRSCLGMTTFLSEDAENVFLFHDEILLAVELHLAAGVLPEEDPVALLDRERQVLAVLGHAAGPDRDDLALLRLLLGAVGNDDAAVLLLVLGQTLDEQAVVQWTQRRRGRRSRCVDGGLSHGAVPLSSR